MIKEIVKRIASEKKLHLFQNIKHISTWLAHKGNINNNKIILEYN